MLRFFITSIKLFSILALLTGILYPCFVTVIAQLTFPHKANGSLIPHKDKNTYAGSHLIGQYFNEPKYFWGRPSATATHPYNAADSSGSNLGPTSKVWLHSIKNRLSYLQSTNPQSFVRPIPMDLLTASGSGLDPHISLEAAEYQVPRIAQARKLPEATVRELIAQATEGHRHALLGRPRVNVLKLNRLLDTL